MTDPAPDPTLAELNAAILAAAQRFTKALLARPRNQAEIDAARAELDYLRALKAELYPGV